MEFKDEFTPVLFTKTNEELSEFLDGISNCFLHESKKTKPKSVINNFILIFFIFIFYFLKFKT